jgi:hypothetical protein
MNVSFKGIEENKAIKVLFQTLQAIEDKIKADVFANRVTWLNDRYDDMETVVSRLFSSNIQLDKDRDTKKVLNRYPPTFRAKLPSVSEIRDDGTISTTFKFDAYDIDNNEIEFENIINKLKGAKAQIIVHLMGLWFAGGKYGCTWKILSGRFQVAKNVKYNYIEDSDDERPKKSTVSDEDSDIDEHDVPIPVTSTANEASSSKLPESEESVEETEGEGVGEAAAEDDLEEEEEEDEHEPAPPPPPPAKKAPTSSKKATKK